MSFNKVYRRAPTVHRRQGPAPPAGASSSTAAASTSTTRPLPAAAYTSSVPPHGVGSSSSSSSTSSSSSSSSSVASSAASSSSSSSASVAPSASAVQSVPSAAASSTPTAVVASVTQTVTRTSSTTRAVASATNTSADSDGMGIGSIAGIAVAAIVGIAVVSAFVVWLIRRKKRNSDIDEEPFNRNSFMRNSTVIPDDDVGIPSRNRPQPNMAERQPTYGGSATFNDPGYNSFGYNTQPSYGAPPQPGYNVNPFGPGGAPATPLPHSPGYGNTYDQGFNQGGYTELTRGGPHDYPPSPHTFDQQFPQPQSPSYVGHDNFPAPPAAATNYPELSPAPASSQGHVVVASNNMHDGRETPVQLGFAPAPAPAQNQARAPNGAPAPGQQGKARPETVYDPEDAYGGM